jgi:hypothetical protein
LAKAFNKYPSFAKAKVCKAGHAGWLGGDADDDVNTGREAVGGIQGLGYAGACRAVTSSDNYYAYQCKSSMNLHVRTARSQLQIPLRL